MNTDTICAIATGAVNSGISIIRISGDSAISVADKIFVAKNGKKLSDAKTFTMHYGHIVVNSETIDEVIVSLMRGPKSYTSEDVIEINCHGGMTVTKRVLEAVMENGARIAEPGEFTKRAFLNGRIDLSQAEAVIDIINSENVSAARNSMGQLTGRLKDKISALREKILRDTAYIEAALDDPEHIELDGFSDELLEHVNSEITEIDELVDSFSSGRIIKEGIRTVIVGKPNVGKSTLLNLLSGSDRAIVTDIPGTTRDTLEETVTINGIALKIIDTAGIRETSDLVEKIGVDKALAELDMADLVIFMADASRKLDPDDEKIIKLIKGRKAVVLLNKSDLQSATDATDPAFSGLFVIPFSAKEGSGVKEFSSKINEMFSLGEIGNSEKIFITNLRHKDLLKQSSDSLHEVVRSIESGMSEDFYSIDLMDAYKSLGLIIGEEIEDDLADKIFKEFCMGK